MSGLGIVVLLFLQHPWAGPRGAGDVEEAGGLFAKFWKQTDNWPMPVPVGFVFLAEALACPI